MNVRQARDRYACAVSKYNIYLMKLEARLRTSFDSRRGDRKAVHAPANKSTTTFARALRRLGVRSMVATLLLPTLASATAVARSDDASPHFGAWGFDVSGVDRTVRPGSDFFKYANGTWMLRSVIQPDRVSYGNCSNLRTLGNDRVRGLLERQGRRALSSVPRRTLRRATRSCADRA